MDIPRLRGEKYLEPGTPIYASDLEAWETFANVKIGSGDAVFIRTGRWVQRAQKGPWNVAVSAAGEHASLMPWLMGTALVHSTVVMEKRDALKVWTILLSILTFSLSQKRLAMWKL